MIALDIAADEKIYLPVTGAHYLLIRRDGLDQTLHNDLKFQEGRNTRFSVLVHESEGLCLIIYSASHTYLHYLMTKKGILPGCYA